MTRLGDILFENLERYHFETHPVWADDPAGNYSAPVLDFDALPDDLGTLQIAAHFETPDGLRFDGYVVDSGSVYALGIFIGDEEFIFDLGLESEGREDLEMMRAAIGDPAARIFPLRYTTRFHYEGEENIVGVFDMFGDGKIPDTSI